MDVIPYCRSEIDRLAREIAARQRQVVELIEQITAMRGGIAAYEDVIRQLEGHDISCPYAGGRDGLDRTGESE